MLAKDSGRVGRLAFYGSPDEAKTFFGRDSMEDIVKCVNRQEEGGEGLADTFIEKYAMAKIGKTEAEQDDPDNMADPDDIEDPDHLEDNRESGEEDNDEEVSPDE